MADNLDSICFFEGQYRPLKEANINIQTHALQYGTACFAGIRGYYNPERDNIFIFRLDEHHKRLSASAKILQMTMPHSLDEFTEIVSEMLRRSNWKQNVYLRPFIYKSDLDLSPRLHNVGDSFAMYALGLDDYLDTQKGLSVCISSWVRLHESQIPTRAKANGGYINSALAKSEAMENGYDEAVFLDLKGNVSEGSASNIFIVKNGKLITPDLSSSILEGITRKTVLELAETLGIPAQERCLARSELYTADEVFFSGTGVQIPWIREVDRRVIGQGTIGPVTAQLQKLFNEIVRGQNPQYESWLTPVYR